MELVYGISALLSILAVGLYTFNYARWCFRRDLPIGGAGLSLLTGLVVALPMWLLFVRR